MNENSNVYVQNILKSINDGACESYDLGNHIIIVFVNGDVIKDNPCLIVDELKPDFTVSVSKMTHKCYLSIDESTNVTTETTVALGELMAFLEKDLPLHFDKVQ